MWPALIPVLQPVLDKILDRIPDPAERARAEREMKAAMVDNEARLAEAASSIINTEAMGNRLQRSWRPVLMYFLMFLIAWLAIIAPALGTSDASLTALGAVPERLWDLLMIGMGGYILGRSGEKIASSITGKKTGN